MGRRPHRFRPGDPAVSSCFIIWIPCHSRAHLAMKIVTEFADVPVTGVATPMRTFVARPNSPGRFPAVAFYSDIFQLTGPMLRISERLAGYGYVVLAPEIYHRIEPAGSALDFDADRDRALEDSGKLPTNAFDADIRALIDYATALPTAAAGKLAAAGFCFGGHLAFRAAMQPDVRAATCFYGTGIHNGKLGADADSGSLGAAKAIHGELLMIFGANDPHIPPEGRATIAAGLSAARVNHTIELFPAEHAFMRDEGPRYDPEATDGAFASMISLFRRVL